MDYGFAVILGLALVASGGGLGLVAYRGASGSLSRNRFAGIRIPATMRSDDAWLAGHRAALWPSLFGAGQAIFGGILLFFRPGPEASRFIVLVVSGVLVVSVAIATFAAHQAASSASQRDG